MDRYLTLEAVRLTEVAALFASRHVGRGNEMAAYMAASDAMLRVLSSLHGDMKISVGSDFQESGLVSGVHLGKEGEQPAIDIALKPLDGKMTCARGGHNATAVIAVGDPGSFMTTETGLMEKIAVGADAKGVIDIDLPPSINIKRVARAKNKYIEDITVCILDREYNLPLVSEIRETGARIVFIRDGDITGVISAGMPENKIDILIGTGGRKEGILAAAALKCLGGDLQARFLPGPEDADSAFMTGVDYSKIYSINDLVPGNEILTAVTGVTDGVLLPGVRYVSGGAETSSIVFRHKTHTIRQIKARHQFDSKPVF